MKKAYIIVLAVLLALAVFVSCDQSVGELFGFNLSFNANGGSGTMKETFIKGSSTPAPANGFTRYGYTFTSWNTMADGSGKGYKIGDEINGYEVTSITLFAQWQPNTYNVNIAASTHGTVTALYDKYTVKEERVQIPLNVETDPGYRLASISVAIDNQSNNTPLIENGYLVIPAGLYGNILITPVFAANDYYVSFNSNGGTGDMEVQSFTFDMAEELAENAFTRTGYTFAGWNLNEGGSGKSFEDCEEVENLSATRGDTVVLYAQWRVNHYSVEFNKNADGATGEMLAEPFTYGIANNLTANLYKRTGYTFHNWNTEEDGSGTAYVNGTLVLNLTSEDDGTFPLYAQWEPHTYTVRFYKNAEDVEGSMDAKLFVYDDDPVALPENEFERTGYEFVKWNTASDGSGRSFDDGEEVRNLTSVDKGVVELYAQWDVEKYDIKSLIVPHGNVTPTVGKYTSHSSIQNVSLTVTPSPGYHLDNLTATAPATVSGSTLTIPAGMASDITLTAFFAPNVYNVTLHTAGGTINSGNVTSYTYGNGAVLPADLSKDGNAFVAWYDNENYQGEPVLEISDLDLGDKEYYALWNPTKYDITFTDVEGGSASALYSEYTISGGDTYIPLINNPHPGYYLYGYVVAEGEASIVDDYFLKISANATGEIEVTPIFIPTVNTVKIVKSDKGSATSSASGYLISPEPQTITLSAEPDAGYALFDWKIEAPASVEIDDGVITIPGNVYGNITVTPIFLPRFKVTLVKNGGTITEGFDVDHYFFAEGAVLPDGDHIKKTGYVFGGWWTNPECTIGHTEEIEDTERGERTFYALWTPSTYYVAFNKNSTAASGSMANQDFVYGVAEALTANAFTRTGYKVVNWNTVATPTTSDPGTSYALNYSESKMTDEDGTTVNLYAQWDVISYSVKFNKNAVSATGTMDNESYDYEEQKALTANGFTRTGYTFGSWNTVAGGTGTSYTDGQAVKNLSSTDGATVNLYAQWTANSYKVKFDKNASTATGTMADESFTYDVAKALTANGFTNIGYTFMGWNTKADGTGTHYADSQSVTNLASSGEITLYAEWQLTQFPVVINSGSGEYIISNLSQNYYTYADTDLEITFTVTGAGAGVVDHYSATIPGTANVEPDWANRKITVKAGSYGGGITYTLYF